MDDTEFRAIEARVKAVSDVELQPARDAAGQLRIRGRLGTEPVEIRVLRDLDPADEGDVRFVGTALSDLRRLIAAVRSGEHLDRDEVTAIESRVEGASLGPWTAFIEADGGQAGCDVIRISEQNGEPDMYLWVGDDLAPSRLFRLVAAARQDIPALLALVR